MTAAVWMRVRTTAGSRLPASKDLIEFGPPLPGLGRGSRFSRTVPHQNKLEQLFTTIGAMSMIRARLGWPAWSCVTGIAGRRELLYDPQAFDGSFVALVCRGWFFRGCMRTDSVRQRSLMKPLPPAPFGSEFQTLGVIAA